MENPDGGGEPERGLGGGRVLNSTLQFEVAGPHLPSAEEDVAMDVAGRDDQVLDRMYALLSSTRSQLARAVEEANSLQVWSSDEEGPSNRQQGLARNEELVDEGTLAKMSAREREAAIKRAKNREAARRSRQRKNERINQLYRDIKSMQQENLLLLKCIEEFTQKAIACKEEQIEMKEQLANMGTQIPSSNTHMETENEPVEPPPPQGRISPVGGIAIPSLEDLQRLRGTDPSLLTARGGSTSARGAAVAEHIAMLSKDCSPREDEVDPAGNPAGTAQAVVPAGPAPAPGPSINAAMPPHQHGNHPAAMQDISHERYLPAAGQQQAPPPNISQFFPPTAATGDAGGVPAPPGGTLVDIDLLFQSLNAPSSDLERKDG